MEKSNQGISVCLWSSLIKVYLFAYGTVKSRYICLLMEQSNQGISVCLFLPTFYKGEQLFRLSFGFHGSQNPLENGLI